MLSAAYRHCARMEHEAEARIVDYSAKRGLRHEEFLLPPDAPQWARSLIADRSVAGAAEAFWNSVEAYERRSDAQLAKEFIIALPVELSVDQNIELVREFVATQILARGQVADWVYHDAPGNPHIHLMTSLRPLTDHGFGPKKLQVVDEDGKPVRSKADKILYRMWAGEKTEFLEQRGAWLNLQNEHLGFAGLDIRVDGRSYAERGIDLVPMTHIGVAAKAIDRKGKTRTSWAPKLERVELCQKSRAENRTRIERRPELVLDVISRETSVFNERDIAKVLHRYVDDPAKFQQLLTRVLQSPEVLRLETERIAFATGEKVPAKYTTRELIKLEAEMANRAIWLAGRSSHGIRKGTLQVTFERHARLSQEQRAAIEHVAGEGRCAAVVGRAGAGKTTMMKAAREAWEAAGYRVVGGALAGKAAEGLEKEAAIPSRTLASWELAWSKGRDHLDAKSIFVLDEAGMVSSRQMALFVEAALKANAKLVLVGDPDQLQPIEAGAAFRAVVERIGYAELETIYRQHEQWMRDASLNLARGEFAQALNAYQSAGKLRGSRYKDEAVTALIEDWNREYDSTKTTLILAHLRRDVRTLNEMARGKLVERGILEKGHGFRTEDGLRDFAAGDQIVFLRNESSLGVKNGMIGHIVEARPGWFTATVGEGEHHRQVEVDHRFYANVDHGYATTIHKSQGATVDRVKVLASLSLDRNLTYVALTRHREDVGLYFGTRSFGKAGGLLKVLSRQRTKETTLDYERGPFYRAALRFADARGLHLFRVAKTLVANKLHRTIRQKQKLADFAHRLAAIGYRLGLARRVKETIPETKMEARPMVAGITTFPKTVGQVVEGRLAADPTLAKQWEDVSARFRLVYADPEMAFRAVNIDSMLADAAAAMTILAKLTEKPEAFGALRGKTGLLASRNDREAREQALLNGAALPRELGRYLRLRTDAARKHDAEEQAARTKVAVDIPALSPKAKQVLEGVCDAINSNDLPAALQVAHADGMVKAELERFAKVVSERFGERAFLSNAAKAPEGQLFDRLSAGMNAAQRADLKTAWPTMRSAQQLAAQERTAEALKQTASLQQKQSQGPSLK